MMKKLKAASLVVGATLLASLGTAGVAQNTPLSFDWEGGYGGIYLGASYFNVQASDFTDTFSNDAPPVSEVVPVYGINLGYNWMPGEPNFVLGVEADVQGGNETNQLVRFNRAGTDGQLYENKISSLASIRMRAGIVNNNTMMYLTGGPAFASVNYRVTSLDPAIPNPTCATAGTICADSKESLIGMAIGVGMEYAIRENKTLKFEIMHYMMPTASAEVLNGATTPVCSTSNADECSAFFDSSSTQLRFGLNFKF